MPLVEFNEKGEMVKANKEPSSQVKVYESDKLKLGKIIYQNRKLRSYADAIRLLLNKYEEDENESR